ncbi:hypothetical protein CU098_000984, partial [Rhizopus stolonifer]
TKESSTLEQPVGISHHKHLVDVVRSMVNTLPDKGAKLKETNDMIDRLLLDSSTISSLDEITAENTNPLECPLTKKLDEMSVLTPHQGARKRSVDLANHQASYHYTSNSLLLKRQSKRPSLSMLQRPCYIQHTNDEPHAKVRMLSLDESMTLQQEQQSSVMKSDQYFDDQVPSRKLLNSLNLSVNVIQDINFDHIEFPKHESDESEDEDRMEE